MLPRESLDRDTRLVLGACETLQQDRENDGIVIDDRMLFATAKTLAGELSDDAVCKLTLIAWHFDGSKRNDALDYHPSVELDRFLAQPTDIAIWRALHERYYAFTPRGSLDDYRRSHGFLLCQGLGSTPNGN